MIELIDSKTLVDHFETEIFNNRGITIRGVFDGGDQERVLADWFSNMGDKVMPEYPSVGAVLKRLAKTYYSQGKEEDEAARLDMLR